LIDVIYTLENSSNASSVATVYCGMASGSLGLLSH
jgi:hypothetical protein